MIVVLLTCIFHCIVIRAFIQLMDIQLDFAILVLKMSQLMLIGTLLHSHIVQEVMNCFLIFLFKKIKILEDIRKFFLWGPEIDSTKMFVGKQ